MTRKMFIFCPFSLKFCPLLPKKFRRKYVGDHFIGKQWNLTMFKLLKIRNWQISLLTIICTCYVLHQNFQFSYFCCKSSNFYKIFLHRAITPWFMALSTVSKCLRPQLSSLLEVLFTIAPQNFRRGKSEHLTRRLKFNILHT